MASVRELCYFAVVLLCLITITVAVRYSDAEKKTGIVKGKFLLMLNDGYKVSDIAFLQQAQSVREIHVGKKSILSIHIDDDQIQPLINHPAVDVVEPNRLVRLIEPIEVKPVNDRDDKPLETETKSMSSFREGCNEQFLNTDFNPYGTWGLIRTSYWNRPNYQEQPYLWAENSDGLGVDVYVFDTGIELDHVEFEGRAEHGMYADEFEHEGIHDYHGHGTHVASTVAGKIYGVAKNATLIDVKVLGGDGWGLLGSNIEGLAWVTEDIKSKKNEGKSGKVVINMSLAYGWHSHIFHASVQETVDLGATVVVGAGNSAEDAVTLTPAAFDNTITVAATDRDDNFAVFSSFGEIVDLAAPGVSITGAWSHRSARCDGETEYHCLTAVSGTSMATPHVAGAVARYLSSIPDGELEGVDQEHVRQMLVKTSSKGFIQYQNDLQRTAVDRILYLGCGEVPDDQTTTTTTTAPPPEDNMAMQLSISFSFIMTLASISLNV